MKTRVILLSLACLLLAANPASAETAASKATDAAKRADYEKMPLADLVRRARGGNSQAQFELGSRFNYGRGVPKNVPEALVWLRRAGLAGQRDAQRLLATKFFNGYDVTIDQEEAFRWTQRLAEIGDVPGQLTLGSMYANGEGVDRSLVRSYMWYDLAAASAQNSAAGESLSLAQEAAEQRDRIGALLLPDEEREAQRLASDWWLNKQGVRLQGKTAPTKAKSKR